MSKSAALDTSKVNRGLDIAKVMARARALGAPGPWRQMLQIVGLALMPPRFSPQDYYQYGFYRRDMTRARRATFLSDERRVPFHDTFKQAAGDDVLRLIEDKLVFEDWCRDHSIPSMKTIAALGVPPSPFRRSLAGVDDIVAFLAEQGVLPVFGKPTNASVSLGAVSVVGVSPDGATLTLGNGKPYPTRQLAEEIVRDWPGGYLFQALARNHPDLAPHLGRATGAMRVVTLLAPGGPEVLYAVQRLPSATAMHDCSSVNRRGFAYVRLSDGVVTRLAVHDEALIDGLRHWLNPSVPMLGMTIPFFHEAVAICIAAHKAIGSVGLIGFDVVIGPDGPALTEANSNPAHSVYQTATGLGVLTPEHEARFEVARRLAQAA